MANSDRTTDLSVFPNRSDVAKHVGFSPRTLERLAEKHDLYKPIRRGIPGGGDVGRRSVIYHRRQVELIEAVVMGAIDLDEAYTKWLEYRSERVEHFSDSQ